MGDHIFSIVPIEVWMDKRLTLEQMRVLGVLFSFRAKNTDMVWPTRQQIAERCGMHVSNISTATTALVNLGWLKKVGKGGYSKSTQYTITVPDIELSTVAEQATVQAHNNSSPIGDGKSSPSGNGSRMSYGSRTGNSTVAEQATRQVAESATRKEQTIEHTSSHQKYTHAKKTRAADLVLPDWLPEEKWRAFVDHRKAIKSPMTEQAQQLAIKKLDGMRAQGQNPIAVIEQSIISGWKGLFHVKDDSPQQRQAYPSGRKSVHDLPGRDAFAGPAVTDGAGNPKAVPALTQEELEEFL